MKTVEWAASDEEIIPASQPAAIRVYIYMYVLLHTCTQSEPAASPASHLLPSSSPPTPTAADRAMLMELDIKTISCQAICINNVV